MAPNPRNLYGLVTYMATNLIPFKFIWIGDLHAPKSYTFLKLGDLNGPL